MSTPLGPKYAAETAPPDRTFYFPIDLGAPSPKPGMTGVFFRSGYRPTLELDIILYLHGHGIKGTIRNLWAVGYPYPFQFRHYLNDTTVSAVLVAPTLGPQSEAPAFNHSGGGDEYIDKVLSQLQGDDDALKEIWGEYSGPPEVRQIVIACHSGGGAPMRRLLLDGFDTYKSKVVQCWGFDCTYNAGVGKDYFDWASTHPNGKMYVYYQPGTGTEKEALILKSKAQAAGLKNVFVTSTSVGHNNVPVTFFRERVRGLDTFTKL